jgi:uncharacterized membrane protein YdjX (TVP38/TMEM64 family)
VVEQREVMASSGGARLVRRAFGFALALVVIVLVIAAGREAVGLIPRFAALVDSLGLPGPLVFVAGYALATVAFVPGSVLTLAAGAVFGLPAVLWVFAGAVLGSSAAFLMARHVARAAVERRLAGSVRLAAIDRAIAARGRRIVLLLRLSPVFPFNLLNYALGLTQVRFRDYVLGAVGMLPGTLLYVYYGKVIGDVAAVAAGVEVGRDAAYWVVSGLGLLATLGVTAVIARAARRALAEATGGF